MRWLTLALLVLAGPSVGTLQAQRLSGSPLASIDQRLPASDPSLHAFPRRQVHPALLTTGGLVGGAVGVIGGALAGAKFTEHDCDDCALVGAAYGAVAGGSTLLPLGVHVANRGRGNLLLSLLSSLAIGAAGVGVAHATNSVDVMVAVPVLQLVSSILIERGTEKGGI